jgi:hypothetical protein
LASVIFRFTDRGRSQDRRSAQAPAGVFAAATADLRGLPADGTYPERVRTFVDFLAQRFGKAGEIEAELGEEKCRAKRKRKSEIHPSSARKNIIHGRDDNYVQPEFSIKAMAQ